MIKVYYMNSVKVNL